MWIFTKYGFFSAVCARKGSGKHSQPVDPDRIMVRARLRSHLKALKERFADVLSDCEIQESAGTDYAFRLFVPKSVWVRVLAGLAEETDYDNFKSDVAKHQGKAGAAYEHSLHDVWSVMHKLQVSEGLVPITAKQIDALLPFLDQFEAATFSAGTWKMPEGQFPFFSFDGAVMEFHQALYDNGWVTPAFDWTEWQRSAQEFVNSPKKIEHADATTIQKLLTTHVRADRFCEGHLAAMFENGHILALLQRLKAIRGKMEPGIAPSTVAIARKRGPKPMTPPAKFVKEFPKEGDLQLFRLEKLHELQCIRCQELKKAKLVAVQAGDWSKLLCNGCYGLLQSKKG